MRQLSPTAMREIGLAFPVAVTGKEKNDQLDVTFRRDGLMPPNAALDMVETVVETITDFSPGFLEKVDRSLSPRA